MDKQMENYIASRLVVCKRCGWVWPREVPVPVVCPKCKNPNWNKDKAKQIKFRRNA